jgi:hypothetical protein
MENYLYCDNDKRRKLSIWSVNLGCDNCHHSLINVGLVDLDIKILEKLKKEADYYIKLKKGKPNEMAIN